MTYLRKGAIMSENSENSENIKNINVTFNPKIGEHILVNGWPIGEDHLGSSVNIQKGNAMISIEIADKEFRIRCFDTSYDYKDDLFNVEKIEEDPDEIEGNSKYIKLSFPEFFHPSSSWANSPDAKDSMELLGRKTIKTAAKAPLGYIKVIKSKT